MDIGVIAGRTGLIRIGTGTGTGNVEIGGTGAGSTVTINNFALASIVTGAVSATSVDKAGTAGTLTVGNGSNTTALTIGASSTTQTIDMGVVASRTGLIRVGTGTGTGNVEIGTMDVASTTTINNPVLAFNYTTVPTLGATQQGYIYNNVFSGTTFGASPYSFSSFKPSNSGIYLITFIVNETIQTGGAIFYLKLYSGATTGLTTTSLTEAYGYATTAGNQISLQGSTVLTLSSSLYYSLAITYSAGIVSSSFVGNFKAVRIA
jgi:hypothetical protein